MIQKKIVATNLTPLVKFIFIISYIEDSTDSAYIYSIIGGGSEGRALIPHVKEKKNWKF